MFLNSLPRPEALGVAFADDAQLVGGGRRRLVGVGGEHDTARCYLVHDQILYDAFIRVLMNIYTRVFIISWLKIAASDLLLDVLLQARFYAVTKAPLPLLLPQRLSVGMSLLWRDWL